MRDEWSLTDHHVCHDLLHYAVVDGTGRIISMNAGMNREFGPESTYPIEYFQSLLEESDEPHFTTLLTAKDDTPYQPVPAVLYTYTGADKSVLIRWSFFHLISGTDHTGYMLCAGYSNRQATQAEDIITVTQHAEPTPGEKHVITAKERQAYYEKLLDVLESERLLIGQELHDNINQLLCTAKLHLELVDVHKADNVQAKQTVQQLIIEAVEEIKKLSRGLVLQQLKKETLLESIKAFIEDHQTLHKINIIFGIHHFSEELLSVKKKFNIYRIIQEQFKNILEHSQAKTVVMTLETDEKNVELIIDDDGIGFDANTEVNGVGLINIWERVRGLNGQCEISTTPGHGCRLHIVIPA